jgi:hypothetical protein
LSWSDRDRARGDSGFDDLWVRRRSGARAHDCWSRPEAERALHPRHENARPGVPSLPVVGPRRKRGAPIASVRRSRQTLSPQPSWSATGWREHGGCLGARRCSPALNQRATGRKPPPPNAGRNDGLSGAARVLAANSGVDDVPCPVAARCARLAAVFECQRFRSSASKTNALLAVLLVDGRGPTSRASSHWLSSI